MRVPAMVANGSTPGIETPDLEIMEVRALAPVEVEALTDEIVRGRRQPASPPTGTKITARHHAIARMLASGHRKSEVAAVLGVQPQALTIVEKSPAFQALLHEYMNALDAASIETVSRLRILGNLGIDELTTRLAVSPQGIKTAEVLDIVKVTMDRTGLGPTSSTKVEVHGRLSPTALRSLKTTQRVFEGEYTEEDHEGGTVAGETAVGENADSIVQCVAEARAGVREADGEDASEEDESSGLIGDLGSVLGPIRRTSL
jgi:hypothetical protein